MGSIFGIDITGEGKADILDDLIMMDILDSDDDPDDEDDNDDW